MALMKAIPSDLQTAYDNLKTAVVAKIQDLQSKIGVGMTQDDVNNLKGQFQDLIGAIQTDNPPAPPTPPVPPSPPTP